MNPAAILEPPSVVLNEPAMEAVEAAAGAAMEED